PARQAVRIPAAVPVLVHRADGLGDAAREADDPRDLGAAVASDLEQLLPAARTEHRQPRELAEAMHQRAVRFHRLDGVADPLAKLAPVAQPDRPLDLMVIAAEQLADSRR